MRFPYLADILKAGVEIDAIDICANNAAHCPVTIEALDHGLHVMCEKPLAIEPRPGPPDDRRPRSRQDQDPDDRPEHALPEQQSTHVRVPEEWRTRRRLLRPRPVPPPRASLPTRIGFIDKNISGGGPVIDIGVHMLDLAMHFINHPRAAERHRCRSPEARQAHRHPRLVGRMGSREDECRGFRRRLHPLQERRGYDPRGLLAPEHQREGNHQDHADGHRGRR